MKSITLERRFSIVYNLHTTPLASNISRTNPRGTELRGIRDLFFLTELTALERKKIV